MDKLKRLLNFKHCRWETWPTWTFPSIQSRIKLLIIQKWLFIILELQKRYQGAFSIVFFSFCELRLYVIHFHKQATTYSLPLTCLYNNHGNGIQNILYFGGIARLDRPITLPCFPRMHQNECYKCELQRTSAYFAIEFIQPFYRVYVGYGLVILRET